MTFNEQKELRKGIFSCVSSHDGPVTHQTIHDFLKGWLRHKGNCPSPKEIDEQIAHLYNIKALNVVDGEGYVIK